MLSKNRFNMPGLFKNYLYALLALTIAFPLWGSDEYVHVTLLHMNDVYEITPVSGGKAGGLARVATLRKQLLAKNPNTLTLIGGDFFSPSAMGTAKVSGERLAGKQMVAVLNALGIDYATFGNHEFDVTREQFYQRMEESQFNWVSSNVFDEANKAFPKVELNKTLAFKNNTGDTFKIGLFGLTLDSNKKDYVTYTDALSVADKQAKVLKEHVDFVLALTHQSIQDDVRMVKKTKEIDLVLGGHEHENYQRWRGNNVPILKADGNARSVYVVELYYNPESGKTRIEPSLVFIDDTLEDDPAVNKVVNEWVEIVYQAFRDQGLDPNEIVTTITQPLDGLESTVRTQSSNLTELIARSMLRPYNEAQAAIFNGGAIRIDDYINAGPVSVYDIIRALPFGGEIVLVEIQGDVLLSALDQGLSNTVSGGFLQWANISHENGHWKINKNAISRDGKYKVAMLDFLLTGRETGLAYLTPENDGITVLNSGAGTDVRRLVADELKDNNLN